MPLGLTVTLLVLGGIVLTGIVGYLIEKSPESADPPDQPNRGQRKPQ
jgi:hypothetical protein